MAFQMDALMGRLGDALGADDGAPEPPGARGGEAGGVGAQGRAAPWPRADPWPRAAAAASARVLPRVQCCSTTWSRARRAQLAGLSTRIIATCAHTLTITHTHTTTQTAQKLVPTPGTRLHPLDVAHRLPHNEYSRHHCRLTGWTLPGVTSTATTSRLLRMTSEPLVPRVDEPFCFDTLLPRSEFHQAIAAQMLETPCRIPKWTWHRQCSPGNLNPKPIQYWKDSGGAHYCPTVSLGGPEKGKELSEIYCD